ncbi:MAG: thioredoxin domain-containing protein [Candidatus Komeilibacteria bacterium]
MKKVIFWLGLVLALTACSRVQYDQVITYHAAKGSDVAKVKVVEWGDFQCPACVIAFQQLAPVWQKYGDKIQIQFRHFPLASIHPYASTAAAASECAADQGKFWEYHDKLYANSTNLKKKDLISYAEQMGLNTTNFTTCLDSQVKMKVVRDDIAEGRKLGIDSTPTFYVDGQKVADWAQLDSILADKTK